MPDLKPRLPQRQYSSKSFPLRALQRKHIKKQTPLASPLSLRGLSSYLNSHQFLDDQHPQVSHVFQKEEKFQVFLASQVVPQDQGDLE